MSIDDVTTDDDRKKNNYHFDRHTPEYREQFQKITEEMQSRCPMAWTDAYNGHWVAADSKHVFELARCPVVSNHHDISGETPYQGITIPKASRATVVRGGILEMDEPEHSAYRGALNPYLSPAAIRRWEPFV
ncbi:MAG TPA: cytochrome P450, partial [Mycobacterium sp.]